MDNLLENELKRERRKCNQIDMDKRNGKKATFFQATTPLQDYKDRLDLAQDENNALKRKL